MADLSYFDRQLLETLFQMSGGYVLTLSNRQLQEFVADVAGRDIYEDRYAQNGTSKANRLRKFWEIEPNPVVGRLIEEMIRLASTEPPENPDLLEQCRQIATNLIGSSEEKRSDPDDRRRPDSPRARKSLELGESIGTGGVANGVYAATDRLWGAVAVKILTRSAEQVSTAYEHARALAKVNHPNVVRVFYLEDTLDPATGAPATGIVMERINGPTLSTLLAGATLSSEDAERIGLGMIRGLAALHAAGVAHTDLHEGNVMVTDADVKIIDVLYRGTLRLESTPVRETIFARDRTDLVAMIRRTLSRSTVSTDEVASFTAAASLCGSASEIENILRAAVSQDHHREYRLAAVYTRVTENGFVAGDDYAKALIRRIEPDLDGALLVKLLEDRTFRKEHGHLLRHIWKRMLEPTRTQVATKLAEMVDADVPNGSYPSSLQFLYHLGASGWNALDAASSARLEKLVLDDIRNGRLDGYRSSGNVSGVLGSYANLFWRFFDRDRLVDVIAGQLLANTWYAQNYIADSFMSLIPRIAEKSEHRAAMIRGLQLAVSNKARVVLSNLSRLPSDWVEEVNRGTNP